MRAAVVGSGPNGLAAAIALERAGIDVDVFELAPEPGGATRSAEITLPGFIHDLGSAVHPMAVASPFFNEIGLQVDWVWSPVELAHPMDDGSAVLLFRDVSDTAVELGRDGAAYRRIYDPIVRNWRGLMDDVLQPLLRIPSHPVATGLFGVHAMQPASKLARGAFLTVRARALFAGLAAHSVLPLHAAASSSFGLMLGGAAHVVGWPIPRGGAGQIARALVDELRGRVHVNSEVKGLSELDADIKMLDITPKQILGIARDEIPESYWHALSRYRYGPGIYKVDWALNAPIPWRAKDVAQAATVHLGGTLEEIEESEIRAWRGYAPERPFVILVQPSLADPSRAPAGKHTAWAYCHVPNGYLGSALEQIESQVERFAPGFRDCILERRTHSPADLEQWNPNLIGGDIGGGAATLAQFLFRPTASNYRTPMHGVYICSSSTPPGGGVHGMCGANAAAAAISDLLPSRKPS